MKEYRDNGFPGLKESFDACVERIGGINQEPKKNVTEYKIPGTETSIRILGDSKDFGRLSDLIDRSAKSKFGRETLEFAAEGGFTLEFTHIPGRGGECTEDGRFVTLTPNASDAALVGVLIHEMRHAGQFIRGMDEEFGKENTHSSALKLRGAEADANMAQVRIGYELYLQGDQEPLASYGRQRMGVANAFFNEADKNQDPSSKKAATEAFKAFFDEKRTMTVYEIYMLSEMERADKLRDPQKNTFDKDIPAKEYVEGLCVSNEGCYFVDDPEILKQGKYIAVTSDTKANLEDMFAEREAKYGIKTDKTLENTPVRTETGEIIPPKKLAQRQESAKNTIRAKKAEKTGNAVLKTAMNNQKRNR